MFCVFSYIFFFVQIIILNINRVNIGNKLLVILIQYHIIAPKTKDYSKKNNKADCTMSLENDLKLEIKQNKEYINNLLKENQHLNDLINAFKKRQSKEESIIPSLRAKMKKYYDLYNIQVEKLNSLEKENKEYKEDVWRMRDELKVLEEKHELEIEEKLKHLRVETDILKNKINSNNEGNEKHLKIENEQLMEKIETLNNKILELENEICIIKESHKTNDTKSHNGRRVSSISSYNNTFLKDSSHISNDFNDTNLLFKQADSYIKKPIIPNTVSDKEIDLIDDLENVLKSYEKKFEEEDAKKKRIDDTFKLFEKIKQRMVSDEQKVKVQEKKEVREDLETPLKLNKLEEQVETITETLNKLIVKKESKPKKTVHPSLIKRYPRLDLDDVSVNESQIDVLGQRRSSSIDQTQVKHNIFNDNVLRNVSNATSRTLNSVRTGLDEINSKNDQIPQDADMDTLNKICAEYEGREVNIDELVDNH